jgi:ATP-dependent Clp protease ATP-binding subunit ClpB
VFYRPLQRNEIYKIIDLQIADLQRRLQEKQLNVELTDAAKEFIMESAFDPVYGARPLKRFIQSRVETLIAKKIIAGGILPRTVLKIDVSDGHLTISEKPQIAAAE